MCCLWLLWPEMTLLLGLLLWLLLWLLGSGGSPCNVG
jgi:hypothetical protein